MIITGVMEDNDLKRDPTHTTSFAKKNVTCTVHYLILILYTHTRRRPCAYIMLNNYSRCSMHSLQVTLLYVLTGVKFKRHC